MRTGNIRFLVTAAVFFTTFSAAPAHAFLWRDIGAGAVVHSSLSVAVTAAAGDSDVKTPSQIEAGARSFIDSMAQRAIGFLSSDTLSYDAKKQHFGKLLQDSFDMETIGRFTLGRYWRVSTRQQQEEYLRLFRKMVIEVYSSRFEEYNGQKFEVRGVRQDGDKDALVTSFLIPDQGPEVQVDWRVRFKGGRYKVVDVIVEGVSMSVTQRSDFSAVIQRGGGDVQVLLAHLRQQ